MVTLAPATAQSARITIRVHVYDSAQEKSPVLYVDDFLMQSFEVPATPKEARRGGYPARSYGVNAATEQIPDSRVGGALHARVGVNPAGGIIRLVRGDSAIEIWQICGSEEPGSAWST